MSRAIIFGSSSSFGNTRKVIDDILGSSGIEVFDLSNFNIGTFAYDQQNRDDDFIPLMKKLIEYDTWVIGTPVYRYNMSTQCKIFFDRFSDLLTIRKDLGHKLRGKKLFVCIRFWYFLSKGIGRYF
jgi:multimeric flavodoxin WrbA